MYKFMNGIAPNYSRQILHRTSKHAYKSSTTVLLHILKMQQMCGQRTLQYKGMKLWKEIPEHVRDASSISVFHRMYPVTTI